jgi:hypothetical protein
MLQCRPIEFPITPAMNISLATRTSLPRNDDILAVVMNPTAVPEATALARDTAGTGIEVSTVVDKLGSSISVNGQQMNLRSAQGVQQFVATLGLPPEQQQKIEAVLSRAAKDDPHNPADRGSPGSLEVLGGIAQVWAAAERGEAAAPSRLLITGHHVGRGVLGKGDPLEWRDLHELAKAMPVAAAQVKDLNVSGCYTGGQHLRRTYQDIFPNLETVYAYTLQAPSTHRGALLQQKAWEEQTRGPGSSPGDTLTNLHKRGADGLRSAEFYATSEPSVSRPWQPLHDALKEWEGRCQRYLSGDLTPRHAHDSELRGYYNQVQELLQQTGVPPQERANWEKRRDKVIAILGSAPH